MSVRSNTELLRKVPLFAGIDPVQLQVLAFSAERVEVAAQDTLFEAGSLTGAGHLVVKGRGEVLKPEGATQKRVAFVDPGAFLGELAMIADLPVTVTVRASTPMRVLRIPRDLFLRVCGEFPEIGAKVVEALAGRLNASLDELRQVQAQFDRDRPIGRA